MDPAVWLPSGAGWTAVPDDDIRELVLHAQLWRAWALDVEEAGAWAE